MGSKTTKWCDRCRADNDRDQECVVRSLALSEPGRSLPTLSMDLCGPCRLELRELVDAWACHPHSRNFEWVAEFLEGRKA